MKYEKDGPSRMDGQGATADLQDRVLQPLEDAGLQRFHLRTRLTAGMGFFTDAYDLFIIGVVSPRRPDLRAVDGPAGPRVLGFGVMAIAYAALWLVPGITALPTDFLLVYAASYFVIEFGPNSTTFVFHSEVFPIRSAAGASASPHRPESLAQPWRRFSSRSCWFSCTLRAPWGC